MISLFIRITPEQHDFLESLAGTKAEHIRRAIDDYLLKQETKNVSTSSSAKGGQNG